LFEYLREHSGLELTQRIYESSKEKETDENKTREDNSKSPGKSLLYCADPYFLSSSEKESHKTSEERKSRRNDDLNKEIKHHDTDEYEGDCIFSLEEHKCK
jgi:hypothetical protein